MADEMAAATDGRRAIHVFFEHLLCQCSGENPAEQACIVSSGLVEGIEQPRIAQALRAKWDASHALLQHTVQRGQADGSIATTAPAAEVADLLLALMSGMRVSARVLPDVARLQAVIARTLAVLDTADA